MDYELQLATTASGVGYFACTPTEPTGFDDALAYLREHPYDEFMHRVVLDRVAGIDVGVARQLVEMARGRDPIFLAVLYEAAVTSEALRELRGTFPPEEVEQLASLTPLIPIKSSRLSDQPLHAEWNKLFGANIAGHAPLPEPGAAPLPPLYTEGAPPLQDRESVPIRSRASDLSHSRPPRIPPEETARHALERLQAVGLFAGDVMQHASSLSPYGYFRKWRLSLSVKNGNLDYTIRGLQTSYGKGITPADAQASYAMEMVERYSSFSSFDARGALGFLRAYPLTRARLSELQDGHTLALDPNGLTLEAPYRDEPLHWLEAVDGNRRPVLVPAQCIFLFCNLDEIALFSGLGSTGLASGNTMQEAKVSGLLECIERDAEAVSPFDPGRCFRLKAQDPVVTPLLEAYHQQGIHLTFQDVTQETGIPCYKAFVIGPQGQVIKGTGAHLNGKRALISAMLEVPYPYPDGPASRPGPEGLPVVDFEELPDYSRGHAEDDLALLETTLAANGFEPLYVDITREDIQLPVVKALIPGMELLADFDSTSRVSKRLWANFLRAARRT